MLALVRVVEDSQGIYTPLVVVVLLSAAIIGMGRRTKKAKRSMVRSVNFRSHRQMEDRASTQTLYLEVKIKSAGYIK